MAKRKNYSGSGILNVITDAVNKVANVNLPFVNKSNFADLAKSISVCPDLVQNLYLENLCNLGFLARFTQQREYESYFRELYGEDILEDQMVIYATDKLRARAYDPEDVNRFLEDHPGRILSAFLQDVVRRQYAISSIEDLITAISRGEAAFNSYYETTITAMWNSYESDNLETIKTMINENLKAGNLYLYPQVKPTDQDSLLDFMVEMDTITSDWNSERNAKYNVGGITTWTPKDDLFYFFNNRIQSMNKNLNLAWAFNGESYLNLESRGRVITMHSSSLADGAVYASCFDKSLFEIHNKLGFPKVTTFFNPGTLGTNKILTAFTLFGMNMFQNSCWFVEPDKVGIDAMTLATRSGSTNANPGDVVEVYVDSITATEGKIADKFGRFQLHDVTVTSNDTFIDPESGELFLGKDETGVELDGLTGKYVRVYCFSHLDENVYGELLIKINS